MAPLAVVASDAGCDEVLPCIFPAVCFRDDVVDREWWGCRSTILAPVPVPANDIFPREDHALVRNAVILVKANNAGKWIVTRNCSDYSPIAFSYNFGFVEIQKNHCSLDVADGQGFIALIENQYPAAQNNRMVLRVAFEDVLLFASAMTFAFSDSVPGPMLYSK